MGINRTTGKFHLSGNKTTKSLKGKYKFNLKTSALTVDAKFVGTFCDAPASKKPFPTAKLISKAGRAMPCVEVVAGEIMEAIQDPCNDGAFFVLPSQLNGAEYPHHNCIVRKVEEYKTDQTGGPRGQLAAHPAMAQFVLDNARNVSNPGGISATDKCFHVTRRMVSLGSDGHSSYGLDNHNGYMTIPRCDHSVQESVLHAFLNSVHTLRILCGDCVPACGLDPSHNALSSAMHKVSLCYASAAPVNSYQNITPSEEQVRFQERIARIVLIAQYYGALRLALEKCKTRKTKPARVYLMLLGGGVFKNPRSMICDAISTAIELLADEGVDVQKDIQIRLLAWKGSPDEVRDATNELRKCGKLAKRQTSCAIQ